MSELGLSSIRNGIIIFMAQNMLIMYSIKFIYKLRMIFFYNIANSDDEDTFIIKTDFCFVNCRMQTLCIDER